MDEHSNPTRRTSWIRSPFTLIAVLTLVSLLCYEAIRLRYLAKYSPYDGDVASLHTGMTKREVVSALGKPLIDDDDGVLIYYRSPAPTVLFVQTTDHEGKRSLMPYDWVIVSTHPKETQAMFPYFEVKAVSDEALQVKPEDFPLGAEFSGFFRLSGIAYILTGKQMKLIAH